MQIDKLDFLVKKADASFESEDLISRIGACTIYSGIMELLAIQAAKLIEQIIVKSRGKGEIHDDSFYYDEKVSSRRILRAIKETLPFSAVGNTKEGDAQKVNELAVKLVESGHRFLDSRNILIHHMGNPEKSLKDIEDSCNGIKKSFEEFSTAQKEFIVFAERFRR